MMGASKGKEKVATRLEDVVTTNTAAVDDTVRPTKETEVLPLPHADMTISELSELMQKYKLVVEHGCYLALFTDLKATPVSSIDPEVEGKAMMGVEERNLYEWFKAEGDVNEFDWDECRRKGETPEGKKHRFMQELLALKIMYRNDQLEEENLYWIRHERPTHFKVVVAYTKIIRAANNIQQGVTKGSGYDYKEYQTTNSLIASAGAIVNNFMAEIHKLLKPIEESKGIIMARRYEMAKKCGIKMDRVGDAVRDAKEMGRPIPGKVTAPSEVPKGAKRLRDDIVTIGELRRLAVTKRMKTTDLPLVAEVNLMGAPDVEDYDLAVKNYRPSSPEASGSSSSAPISSINKTNTIIAEIEKDQASDKLAALVSNMTITNDDVNLIRTARVRVAKAGGKSMATPRGLTGIGSILVALINRLLRTKPASEKEIAERIKAGTIGEWMFANGGYVWKSANWQSLSQGEDIVMK